MGAIEINVIASKMGNRLSFYSFTAISIKTGFVAASFILEI